MIVAGTGHRPEKLRIGVRDGYHAEVHSKLCALARAALVRWSPSEVISGMAQGWDTALAQAALDLTLPLRAYIPFEGQESRWPVATQRSYRDMIGRAATVVIVSPGGYSREKMQLRNERMVDDGDLLLALWNGTSGGTRNCLSYAEEVGRRTENLWRFWVRHTGPRRPHGARSCVEAGLLAAAGGL